MANHQQQTVLTKDGRKIAVCSYRWVDPDGEVEECHHVATCQVCGQCSRLVGDHEAGHCTGHLGLDQHIGGVPGRDNRRREERR